jgi:hypothetical protein
MHVKYLSLPEFVIWDRLEQAATLVIKHVNIAHSRNLRESLALVIRHSLSFRHLTDTAEQVPQRLFLTRNQTTTEPPC